MVAKIVKFGALTAALVVTGTAYAQAPLPNRMDDRPVATDPGFDPGYAPRPTPRYRWGRHRGIDGPRPGDRQPSDFIPPRENSGGP